MVVNAFGQHVSKQTHNRETRRIIVQHLKRKSIVLENGVFDVKKHRITGLESPKEEKDAVNVRYVNHVLQNFKADLKKDYENFVNQNILVQREWIEKKINNNNVRSIHIVNLHLKLNSNNEYKIGNTELPFYTFPIDAHIKMVQYNPQHLIVETLVNNKPLALEGLSVSKNDKLMFKPLSGHKTVDKISVDLILEISLVLKP